MVPQATAGSVIGKGGQNISDLQKEYSVHIRMSKANDVFPGRLMLLEDLYERSGINVLYLLHRN